MTHHPGIEPATVEIAAPETGVLTTWLSASPSRLIESRKFCADVVESVCVCHQILSYVLAMIMDVGGNALVIFIVVVSKRMRTPTNVLLVNLAVADLLVAALCMWVHLGANITPEWPFGLLICKVNMFAQGTITDFA